MGNSTNHFTQELTELLQPIEQQRALKLKLILHAGTPKTGTTSLQTYLNRKQGKLRRKGLLFPHNTQKITNPFAPKHQWFEKNLVTAHTLHFLENFKNILSQVDMATHTILLSSEGIYNYWWDFPDESKALLAELSTLFDTEIWVWFRDPLEFIESYYKQCIRNPKIEGNQCYGSNLSFAEMLDIHWFSQHLNYQGFVTDCQALFGESSVLALEYKGDVVQSVIEKLGLATPHDNPTPRQNNSLNSASVALLRTINQFAVKNKDKDLLMPHIKAMNEILQSYGKNTLIDEESRKRVLKLVRPVAF